jgi:two-component system cell cycle sensor histidine kinase/response regulator CckA
VTRTRSLRRVLLLGSAVFVGGAAIALAGFLYLFSSLERDFEADVRASVVEQRSADAIVASVYAQMIASYRGLQNPGAATIERVDSLGQIAHRQLRDYLVLPMALESRLQVEVIRELHEAAEVEAHLAVDLIRRGELAAARSHADRMEAHAHALEAAVSRFASLREEERRQQHETQATALRRALAGGALFVVVLIGGALLFLRAVTRRVVRPLAALSEASAQLGQGDLSARVPPQRDEELEAVAKSFNEMAARLQAAQLARDEQEKELFQTRESLILSEERYRDLFEASPLPTWVLDTNTLRFLAVNEAAVRHYGYSREQFATMAVTALWPEGDDTAARRSRIRERTPGGANVAEVRHVKRGGEIIDVEITSQAIFFGGRPAILALGHDVSERKQLQRQFLQAQKMEGMGQLAAGVAHDFNNQLAVITGYGGLLLNDDAPIELRHEAVSEILRAAQRSATLTRQLLAFGRRQVLNEQPLNLNEVVGRMESMVRRLIPTSVDLQTVLDPDLGIVEADMGQIEQSIVNLVLNANDAMPQGGKLVIATANAPLDAPADQAEGAGKPEEFVMLSVSDTGTGMTEEVRQRMLEPFFTTKGVGRGSGLGLSTVAGFVKQSGGQIAVETTPGRGTTFRIYLPRVAGTLAVRSAPPLSAASQRGSGHILLVEDEAPVRRLLTRALKGLGYAVTVASNGEEALDIARAMTLPPDLLVSDLMWPRLPVLFISGYSADAVPGKERPLSGAEFLAKPFTPSELGAKVQAALADRDII